jgi:1,4-alpha-glucan branching enzyme
MQKKYIPMLIPDFVRKDEYLLPYAEVICGRLRKVFNKENELVGPSGSLSDFALGHMYYGLHKESERWVYRDWAPNAQKIYLIGAFSGWKPEDRFSLQPGEHGDWELALPSNTLQHGDLYKLLICWDGGSGDRIPAWTNRVIQDPKTMIFNAQVWDPPSHFVWENPAPDNLDFVPVIYEAHVGMATEKYGVGTWEEFRTQVLPNIERAGYNTIQMMAVQEHPYYGSFGYHVSNFFAPSSRFGTPEDLKALIDDAHGRGIRVIMDIVHSHAVKNEIEGISKYDGTYYQFFHDGPRGDHTAWDSRCFDYGKNQVLHFLLSNCKYWLDEYQFDGFRFDGVTSMLYLDHGLGSVFNSYDQYYNLNQDEDAIVYLHLANKLIHQVKPQAITIAEEMSGMPGLATPLNLGGYGFDYRLAMGVPDFWIKTIKEKKVELWNIGDIFYNLSNKRIDEKTIHYAESHDQALVGDKTIIFWLMDKDMYFDMHVDHQNIVIDNGMALHKMIRLVTIATAGNGYLNFMGNEFGHPEWIDFPGAHNNWSYHYARRQWSLRDNLALRFRFLNQFDKAMINWVHESNILQESSVPAYLQHVDDQVLVFGRSDYLFLFNFSPFNSYTDYAIPVPGGVYKIMLDSDDAAYGGFGRVDHYLEYTTNKINENSCLKLYIPTLTGLVFKKIS